MNPVTDGVAGTTGEANSLEAVKISLAGDDAKNYSVYYKAHVANIGWQDWHKDGEEAGTTGQSLPIEAIRILVIPKSAANVYDASDFVLLSDVCPDVIQEVRYYTTYNFVGSRIDGYEQPVILMTKEAAAALKAVNDDLMKQGYRLRVFDAYRPQRAVDHFVRWAEDLNDQRMKPYFYPEVDKTVLFDEGYIAKRSGHTRGSTIDLTVFNNKTGKDLDMGGTFDYFGERSHPDFEDVTQEQYNNRMILRNAMIKHGFRPLSTEWWHFTLNDEPYTDTYFNFPVNTSSVNR